MQVLAQKGVTKWPGKIHPKSRENPVQIFDRILKSQNLNFFRETSFWPNFGKNLLTVRGDLAEIAADNPNSVIYLQNFGKNLLTNQTFLIGFGQKIFFNFWAKFCSNVGSLDASQPGDWTNFGPILDTKSWKKSSDRVRRFFPRFGQIKNFEISKFQILEIQHFFNFWAKNH